MDHLCRWEESNLQPELYEGSALTVELHRQLYIIIHENSIKINCINKLLLAINEFIYYNVDMKTFDIRNFTKSISVAVGIILIWRGIWIVLDIVDESIFGGNHVITAIGGIIIGIVILYLPEKNLKALERL